MVVDKCTKLQAGCIQIVSCLGKSQMNSYRSKYNNSNSSAVLSLSLLRQHPDTFISFFFGKIFILKKRCSIFQIYLILKILNITAICLIDLKYSPSVHHVCYTYTGYLSKWFTRIIKYISLPMLIHIRLKLDSLLSKHSSMLN